MFPVGNQKDGETLILMKQKTDVLQGTRALTVLKTVDALGRQHGYGVARRIEQIGGDRLAGESGDRAGTHSNSDSKETMLHFRNTS